MANYTACHHDGDGEAEYWQGVPKAREMHCTSPFMHKEEVRRISLMLLDSVSETVVASFMR
jgi:hypothetical protein